MLLEYVYLSISLLWMHYLLYFAHVPDPATGMVIERPVFISDGGQFDDGDVADPLSCANVPRPAEEVCVIFLEKTVPSASVFRRH